MPTDGGRTHDEDGSSERVRGWNSTWAAEEAAPGRTPGPSDSDSKWRYGDRLGWPELEPGRHPVSRSESFPGQSRLP